MLASQLARPRGMAGCLIGRAMDLANRRPVRLAVELLDPSPGERILDAGCGTGGALECIAGRAECDLVGIDPSHTMLVAAGARLGSGAALIDASLGSLPFADGTFDAALALNMFYFCDREGRMIADLRRVLRPGGRLVAYVTHRQSMESWSFARAGYHRLYDADELAGALTRGGFAFDSIVIHEWPVASSVRGLFAMAIR